MLETSYKSAVETFLLWIDWFRDPDPSAFQWSDSMARYSILDSDARREDGDWILAGAVSK